MPDPHGLSELTRTDGSPRAWRRLWWSLRRGVVFKIHFPWATLKRLIFHGGKEIGRFIGAASSTRLDDYVKTTLARIPPQANV